MILLALACTTPFDGRVLAPDGSPVAGARITGERCAAVTDDRGLFAVRCPRGPHPVHVTRPGYVDGDGVLDGSGVLLQLIPYPTEPGLYVRSATGFSALPTVPLTRKDAPGLVRWCLGAAELPALSPVELYDVHAADWRAFRLDADGCAWTLRQGSGTYWSSAGEVLPEPTRTNVAPGRDRLTWELEAGRYVVAEWLDNRFVTDDATKGTVRAWGFSVP